MGAKKVDKRKKNYVNPVIAWGSILLELVVIAAVFMFTIAMLGA